VTGGAQRHLAGVDLASGRLHRGDPVAVEGEPGDLAVLDEVDAQLVRTGA
jgi:hypothetical protein